MINSSSPTGFNAKYLYQFRLRYNPIYHLPIFKPYLDKEEIRIYINAYFSENFEKLHRDRYHQKIFSSITTNLNIEFIFQYYWQLKLIFISTTLCIYLPK